MLTALMTVSMANIHADSHNRNQVASMEYLQWSFTPKGYYYSWVKKKIWPGITIKIPGAGVHDRGPAGIGFPGDRYVSERWRQMSPLRAGAVALAISEKKQVDKLKDRWMEIMKRDMLVQADKTLDLGKLIEDDRIGELKSKIAQMASSLPAPESERIMAEYERIVQNIRIIHKAFIPNADKIVGYRQQMMKLEKLKKITKTISLLKDSEKRIKCKSVNSDVAGDMPDDWYDIG